MAQAVEPVLNTLRQWVHAHTQGAMRQWHGRPLMVGLSGPQGIGKTTLVRRLVARLADEDGLKAVAMSLDDVYLPYDAQQALADAHPDNALLQYRGNAGTHCLPLLLATLTSLRAINADGGAVAIPAYDKTARNGRGDQRQPHDWPVVRAPVHIVLFEGWMLGFEAVADDAPLCDERLRPINAALRAYAAVHHHHLDAFVQLVLPDLSLVYAFRLQAEHEMAAASGRPGLDDQDVRDFVDRFMPAYHQYLPELLCHPPCPLQYLRVDFNADRSIARTTDVAASIDVANPDQ